MFSKSLNLRTLELNACYIVILLFVCFSSCPATDDILVLLQRMPISENKMRIEIYFKEKFTKLLHFIALKFYGWWTSVFVEHFWT